MNVMVSGATGFIGSNLVRRLLRDNHSVSILHLKESSLDTINDIKSKIVIHIYDGSTESVMEAFKSSKAFITFHLASCFLATHSYCDIINLVESNVLFGTQILEGMKSCGCNLVVNAGTSWQHYKNEKYNPVCLYAATKQAYEDIIRFYVEAYGFRSLTLELFDTYGRNDQRPKLMNLLKKVATTGEVLEMSAGEQMIDMVYIDDVIDAFLIASERIRKVPAGTSEVYSVSSGRPLKLRELILIYTDVTGKCLNIELGKRPYREREVMELWTNGNTLPGWIPCITLEDGIRKIHE